MARERETSDYLAMVRRMIRAAGRRCGDADEIELAQLLSLHEDIDAAMRVAIDGMRARGCSWAYIAAGLGTTRQAAQMRWGRTAA